MKIRFLFVLTLVACTALPSMAVGEVTVRMATDLRDRLKDDKELTIELLTEIRRYGNAEILAFLGIDVSGGEASQQRKADAVAVSARDLYGGAGDALLQSIDFVPMQLPNTNQRIPGMTADEIQRSLWTQAMNGLAGQYQNLVNDLQKLQVAGGGFQISLKDLLGGNPVQFQIPEIAQAQQALRQIQDLQRKLAEKLPNGQFPSMQNILPSLNSAFPALSSGPGSLLGSAGDKALGYSPFGSSSRSRVSTVRPFADKVRAWVGTPTVTTTSAERLVR